MGNSDAPCNCEQSLELQTLLAAARSKISSLMTELYDAQRASAQLGAKLATRETVAAEPHVAPWRERALAAEARLFLASGDDEVIGALRRSLAAEARVRELEVQERSTPFDAIGAGLAEGAAAMQAAVVAWLRAQGYDGDLGDLRDEFADAIESGAHLHSTEGER